MIHYIQGQLQRNTAELSNSTSGSYYIINDTRGIQAHYQGLQSSKSTKKKSGIFFLHPHMDENNKTIQYLAFDTAQEKASFLSLLKISGIGLKTAFHINAIPLNELEKIIENVDIKALQKIPGVGPKTARRIIIEVQQDLSKKNLQKLQQANNPHSKELQQYLQGLGYQKELVIAALESYPKKITKKNSKEVLSHIMQNL